MAIFLVVPQGMVYVIIFGSAPDRHEISSAEGSWHQKNILKVLELNTIQFRKEKKMLPRFSFIFFVC